MNKKFLIYGGIGCAILLIGAGAAAMAIKEPALDPDRELAYCDAKVKRTLSELKDKDGNIDYTMQPRNIAKDSTRWHLRPVCAEEWCSGFYPGVLWYDYELTGDKEVLRHARKSSEEVGKIVDKPVFDHDLGFLVYCSLGNGYRLTKDASYKRVLLNAADSLATLYNPKVGTILAWPRNIEMFGGHNTIMDTMMNLELLFWASKNGGNPCLHDIAVKHAETTMRHHFRPDNTCYHVAVYNQDTGEFIRGCTHQGYSDSSVWARGQSWAVYGYTVVYRETRDNRFLDFAKKVTDAYLARLPQDHVPYWDFDDPRIPNAPRDASAACVVASALFELSCYVDSETSARYLDAAKKMLASLSSENYKSADTRSSFLDHSTGHHPAGSEIDASIVYADYYYIEALSRLKRLNEGRPVVDSAEPMQARAK